MLHTVDKNFVNEWDLSYSINQTALNFWDRMLNALAEDQFFDGVTTITEDRELHVIFGYQKVLERSLNLNKHL